MTESKSNTPYFTPYDEEGSFNIELDDTINPTYQNSSVTDFTQDKQVIRSFEKVTDYLSANRGVGSALLDQATIGKQTDIAEFMRDDVSRLGAPLAKAAILKDAPEDVKAAYRLMQDRFNASSLTGIGEHVDAFIDYGTDVIFNPEILATAGAVLAAPLTAGSSLAVRGAAGVVSKKATKEVLRNALKATRAAGVANPYKASAAIGSLYGGAGSYVAQDLDVGIDQRESVSGAEVAVGVGIGAVFGAGLYGATSLGRKYFAKGTDPVDEISPTAVQFDEAVEGEFMPISASKLVEQLELFNQGKIDIEGIDVSRLAEDLGGGEKTKKEIKAAITASIKDQTTSEGVTNAFKQKAIKIATNLNGNFFGKAASVLTPYTDLSATAKVLQAKLSHEFAIGFKRISKLSDDEVGKVVDKDLGEVQREVTGGFNEKFRAIVEDISIHSAKGTLAEDVNKNLMVALRSNKSVKFKNMSVEENKAVNKAALAIRGLYNEMGVKLNKIKVIDKLVDNYIPRMWDRKAIEADPEKLAKLLESEGGYAKGTGMKTVKDMLDIKDQIDSGGAGGHFFSAKRKLNNIENDAVFQEFLNADVLGSLHTYTYQAGKSIAKHRVLGVNNIGDFRKAWTDRIARELKTKGQQMTEADTKQIDLLYKTATGEGMERYGKGVQNVIDAYGFTNRVTMLPLATLSSLTEVFINITKAGVVNSAKGFREAMELSHKGVTKDLHKKLTSNDKLTAQEAFSEMRKFSINMDQAMAQVGNRLAGDDLMNETLQNASNKFFRITMLDQWTKFVQTASYASGKQLIHENLEALAANGTRPLDLRLKTMAGELGELGIDYKQGVKWLQNGSKRKDSFYEQQVLGGAARYTNAVVLQPTAMSGLKPLLHSNPKTAIAFQLLGYPVAFTNTVLKGAAKQLMKNPSANAPKIMAGAAIMTGMARYTNYVRSDGRSEEGKDFSEIIYNSIARWGGNGILLDSFNRARTSSMYTQSSLPYASMAIGPIGSDAIKMFQEGIIPVVGGKVPILNGTLWGGKLLGEDAPKEYRRALRKAQEVLITDKLVKPFGESATKIGYNKGGEVLVPNAPAEPDERIDKITGLPYNQQAGSAFVDSTDPIKALLNRGGSVTRSKYGIGSLVTRQLTKPVMEFGSETASSLSKSVDNLFNRQTIENAAQNIDNQVDELAMTGDIDLDNISAYEYIDAVVVNNLEGNNFKSVWELENIPAWKKAISNTDSSKQNDLWADAQQSLGISQRKRQALEVIRDLQDDVDDRAALESVIPNSLGRLSSEYRKVKVELTDKELDAVDMSKFNEDTLNNVEDFLQEVIKDKDITSLSEQGLEDVVSKNVIKLIAAGDVDFTKFKAPSLADESIYPGISARDESLSSFIADSVEKQPVFRGVTSFVTADRDVSFAFPREIGTHVGTQGQATTILVRGLPNTALKQQFKEEIDSGTLTQQRMSELFSDEDLAQGNFLPEINESTAIVDDMPIDTGYFGKFEDELEPSALKPLTMKKGYINIKKPLLIDSDLAGWEAERVVSAGGGFDEYFLPQLGKINKEQAKTLESLRSRAETLTALDIEDTTLSAELKADLMKAEYNIDFREFLKTFGFDSIMYRNEVEMSLKGDKEYSYILFDPEQFKVETARAFDPKDVREGAASGGYMRSSYSEGGSVYEIKGGDTLSAIAKSNNTTVQELAGLNKIEDVNKIYAGKQLLLPSTEIVSADAPFVAPESVKKQAKSLDQQLKEAFDAVPIEEAKKSLGNTYEGVKKTASKTLDSLSKLASLESKQGGRTAQNTVGTTSDRQVSLPDIDFEGLGNAIADVGSDVSKNVGEVYDDVSSKAVEVLDSGKEVVSDAYDNVTETANKTLKILKRIASTKFSSEGRVASNTKETTKNSKVPKIPTMIRQFLYDVGGGEEKLTEKDLLSPELEFLTSKAIEGHTSLEYKDYETASKGQSQYADVGGGGSALDFFNKLSDPAYSMKTTLGQAKITKNKKGETVIVDQYNFNDSDGAFNLLQFLKGIKNAGFSPYAQARNIGRQLGSPEGEGSMVEINLGQLDSKENKRATEVVAGI
jgi:LysM repeat protein